jgi:hypothetical protein
MKSINRNVIFHFITVFIIINLLCTSISCAKNSLQNIEWIPFKWHSEFISGRYIERTAMFIPVTIDRISQEFIMQFDLAAFHTIFYGNTFKYFLDEYPLLNGKLDTTKTFWMQNTENPFLRNVDLLLGKVAFKGIDVGLFNNFGNTIFSSVNPETEILIGTIGADLVQNKILIINYQSNRLAIIDTLPYDYQNASFKNIIIGFSRSNWIFAGITGALSFLACGLIIHGIITLLQKTEKL